MTLKEKLRELRILIVARAFIISPETLNQSYEILGWYSAPQAGQLRGDSRYIGWRDVL